MSERRARLERSRGARSVTAAVKSGAGRPILLLFGPEEYLASRSLREFRDLARAQDASLASYQLQAAEYQSGELASIASPSLFGEGRFIVFDGLEQATDELLEDLQRYLESPIPDVLLVLRHSGSSQRGKRLLEALRASALVREVQCAELKRESDRLAFVRGEFKSANRSITQAAAQALVDAFSGDLAELAAACSQLLVDTAESIDEAVVERYFGGRVETDAFKVVGAALTGSAGEALLLLRHALAGGADPVPLVAAITMKVRQLAKVFSARGASANQLGMQPWQVEQARKSLVGWTEEGLILAIQELARADAAVKGAERDPEFALERLLLMLAQKAKTPQG